MITGFAFVDKSAEWTSHDVVARLRRLYGQRRVGHAGTLDPMATGVLVCGLGYATRLLQYVQGHDKTYRATIRVGIGTTTDDAQGEVSASPGCRSEQQGRVPAALAGLTGQIQQVPSAVSAIKVGGQRSYALVRAGQTPELAARPITVRRFDLVAAPRRSTMDTVPVIDLDVEVLCSTGTYVRALARDLGAALDSAAHLTALRRTALGPITVGECSVLRDQPPEVHDPAGLMARVLPTATVTDDQVEALRHGRPITLDAPPAAGPRAVLSPGGRFVGLITDFEGGYRPLLNLPAVEG